MAEITNGGEGQGRTTARVKILAEMSAGLFSMVSIGPAMLNADLGVVRAEVSFWQGDRELCQGDVLLHSMSVQEWEAAVRALIAGEVEREFIHFPSESPELIISVWRSTYNPGTGPFTGYDLVIALDAGVFDPAEGISGTGPGVYLYPTPEELLKFAQDLLAETEAALKPRQLFGKWSKLS